MPEILQTDLALFYDDLPMGQAYRSVGRTLTEADVVNYAGLSGDFNTIHTDAVYAAGTPFRQRIAHGFAVFSVASGLTTHAPPMRTVALLEVRNWKFVAPVFIGDTICIISQVKDKALKGRGKRGEIVWYRKIVNQHDKTVQEGDMVTLVECRPISMKNVE